MAMLAQAGRFKGHVVEAGLQEKESGSIQLCLKFVIDQIFDEANKTWADWSEYGLDIFAYVNIIKKDGNPNEIQIKSICDSFGWDGTNFAWLEEIGNYAGKLAQLTVENDTYDGKTQLKVQWVNPENYEGFKLEKLDAAAVKNLNAKFGSKLRAIAPKASAPAVAGAPVPTAPKPVGAATKTY